MSEENIDREIVELTHKILEDLGLELPEEEFQDYEFLQSDTFFIDIFKNILGNSPQLFDEERFMEDTKKLSSGQRIQSLIDKLDSEILGIDLDHIKGEKIAQGDKKHILNLLQLLDALSMSDQNKGKLFHD
jgi:hypothetical protein